MKVVQGYWHVKPTEQEMFLELCKWIAPFSKKEEGALSYYFCKDAVNEDYYLFIEEWENQEALDFHLQQWYFKSFMEKATPMLLSKPIIKVYDINQVSQL
jgi:quinol monooxygenase YgiN